MQRQRTAKSWLKVGVALAAIYLIWGTTYAAVRVAVTELPPLLMGGARFTCAGAALAAVLLPALRANGLELSRVVRYE